MQRRQFVQGLSAVGGAWGVISRDVRATESQVQPGSRAVGSFSMDRNSLRFQHPAITEPKTLFFLADTHLSRIDERDDAYRDFSARMAGAYRQTEHFETRQPTDPERALQATLQRAGEASADLVALAGDILSFPSAAGVDWVRQQLQAVGLPWLYVAGNHDWHYEGMPGTLTQLRTDWVQQRLAPLYQHASPWMMAHDLGQVRIVSIDNSTYQVTDEQLGFFRAQVDSGRPLLLVVHIPLYVPGRPVGFGCGHPAWGTETDQNFALERRERWPARQSDATFAFHEAVFAAPNLLGILAGHIHRPSVDVVQGIPQIVTAHNATGAYLRVDFQPAEKL